MPGNNPEMPGLTAQTNAGRSSPTKVTKAHDADD
jgi:hypothetical protein